MTSLLVLTTLFISVSGNLPKTAYIKMIDIWLIVVLCVPFFETILHTIIDSLREEEDIVVNHHGGTMQVKNNTKKGPDSVTRVSPMEMELPKSGGQSMKRNVNLVARNEFMEIGARKKLYEMLVINNETVMRVCQVSLKAGLPMTFIVFSICYFIYGFAERGL